MSLRRSSSGDLRNMKKVGAADKTSTSPTKRASSAKSRTLSSRSTSSQASSVSDLSLNVSPAATTKKCGSHLRGNSMRSVPVTSNNNTRINKPKINKSTANKNSIDKQKSLARPAWMIKTPDEEETPRSEYACSSISSNLPTRPSIDDFLDTLDINKTSHNSNHGNKNRNSLLEYLTADTARTDRTNFTEQTNSDTTEHNNMSQRSDSTHVFEHNEKLFAVEDTNIVDLQDVESAVMSWGSYDKKHNENKNNSKTTKSNNLSKKSKQYLSSERLSSTHNNSTKKLTNNERLSNIQNRPMKKTTSKNVSIPSLSKTTKRIDSKLNNNSNKLYTSVADEKNYINHSEGKSRNTLIINENYEELSKIRYNIAARYIQRWWRKINLRHKAGNAAMKRMMESKRYEMEQRMNKDREKEYEKQMHEYEEMRRREEQERLIREEMVQEMKQNREEKLKTSKSLKFMNSKGKVSKTTDSKRKKIKKENVKNDEQRPSTASSVGRKVDELFESSMQDTNSDYTETLSPASTLVNQTNHIDDVSTHIDDVSNITDDFSKNTETRTTSTLDDLFNSLKELEEEPIITKQKVSANYNAPTKYNSDSYQLPRDEKGIGEEIGGASNYLSADKLKNIMSFLDEVEKIEEDVRTEVMSSKDMYQPSTILSEEVSPSKDSMLESASQVATDISDAITRQKIEMDEKKRTVEMMQKAINQQKEFTSMQIREMDKEHKQQLNLQRQEYESTIQRHLSFIDQLIDDKKVLTQRCEDLVKKLKDIDQKYSSKIKQLTESHVIELRKQREINDAAEKLRREKWIKEKTQEIKEMTVKGLEPDIQKLIAKHKAEIKKIKASTQGEILEVDERVGRKFVQQMEDLRNHLDKEKEIAVKKEKELAREKFEMQLREEENSYQQQRRRLYKEIEEEKERCSEQIQQIKREYDDRRSAMESLCKQTVDSTHSDQLKQIEELQDKHDNDMKNFKEKIEIEKQQWIENYMKKQETYLLTKERELKEGVKDSRDREIEMVIQRLEQETALNREELEKAADNRIKRLRDKYERDIKDYESSEKVLQAKCNNLKEHSEEKENESLLLKSETKRKTQELLDLQKLTERLQEERGKVTDIIRQEFADRLVALEEESKRLRTELSEEKARHRYDVDRVNKDKENELDEVHKRVKQAISKKEETTKLLRQQMLASEKRAEHLEQLLAEQRKKILSS